jgi:serine/threonine protein kinase
VVCRQNNSLGIEDIHLSIRGLEFAHIIRKDEPLTGRVSRRYTQSQYAFTAPEMDGGFIHDARVDNWSLGATMYMILCGTGPFGKEGKKLMVDKNGEIEFTARLSENAKVLIRRLMMDKPEDRIGINEVLTDDWNTLTEAALKKNGLEGVKLIFKDYDAVPLVFGQYDAATVQVVLPEPTYVDNYREPDDDWKIRSLKPNSVTEKSLTISEDVEYEE